MPSNSTNGRELQDSSKASAGPSSIEVLALPLCTDFFCDGVELLQRGLQIVGDFLGQNIRQRQVVGVFEAGVFEPEDVEVHFVAFE